MIVFARPGRGIRKAQQALIDIGHMQYFDARQFTGAGELPGVEVLHVPDINQGLLRFPDPSPGASEDDHDRRTEAVTARIVASGEAHFACTTWRGRRCMRVSVCGCATDAKDVAQAIAAIAKAL